MKTRHSTTPPRPSQHRRRRPVRHVYAVPPVPGEPPPRPCFLALARRGDGAFVVVYQCATVKQLDDWLQSATAVLAQNYTGVAAFHGRAVLLCDLPVSDYPNLQET